MAGRWKTILVVVLIVLNNHAAFTQACVWSKRTLEVVSSCPATEEATQEAARSKECEGLLWRQNCTKSRNFKYHCLYSYPLRKLVEVCAVEIAVHGGCLMYDTTLSNIQHIDNVECGNASTICPHTYMSTEAHFLAPCPNLMNFTFENTHPTINTPEDTNHPYWIIVLPLAIVIIMIMGIIILWIRRRRYSPVPGGDEESQPLEQILRNTDAVKVLGKYDVWRTSISDQFSSLSKDEVSVLFCFLCSDSGIPDFTDTDWLDILNHIRLKVYIENRVTSEEAQRTLERLKSRGFPWHQDGFHITEDAEDETMYLILRQNTPRLAGIAMIRNEQYDVSCLLSLTTAVRYLRSRKYTRESGEKCVISVDTDCDSLLTRRLQMNILTNATMEDTNICDEVSHYLSIPLNKVRMSEGERGAFLEELKQTGERVQYSGGSQGSVQHVKWLWRYRKHARPDIVRSCIGLHPHCDIYIINNTAYRKHSWYHDLPPAKRCLLYCLLMVDDYTVKVKDESHIKVYNAIRERYFTELPVCEEITAANNHEGIIHVGNEEIKFKSDDIRHDVMYAFVTDCLMEDSDLKFFLTTVSRHVISEYCRSWGYKRSEGERCLYIPPEMYDLFIDRLQLDIISHCTMSDREIDHRVSKFLGVPREILSWDQEARERYVGYVKRGTQTVHHARGMIVGCAGAGKTTLLKRLLRCSDAEIMGVTSTIGLDVHQDIFQICDESKILQAIKRGEKNNTTGQKTLSMFDFGGQSVYYACHQIYLSRRAFYLVVVDASKCLDQVVDENVCDQAGTVFSKWTYKDYFVFWIKSIHTYCGTEKEGEPEPGVIIVATHWDQNVYEDIEENLKNSLRCLFPKNSSYGVKYIRNDNCFFTKMPQGSRLESLSDLEKHIVDIVCQKRWAEQIPIQWAFMEFEIQTKQFTQRIEYVKQILSGMQGMEDVSDMLRYYHDAGKVLYFKETALADFVILDVQWFVDAFKNIITDKLHLMGIEGRMQDWEEYYKTGHLRDRLLKEIWRKRDLDLHKELLWNDEAAIGDDISNDSRYLLPHKDKILMFMERLGLVAVGEESHYVPCINREEIDSRLANIIFGSKQKTSVLIFQFDFLPFFVFYRLIVSCMQEMSWKVLESEEKLCLYRDMALFSFADHHIAIAVTETAIQLQVYHPVSDGRLNVQKTRRIQRVIEEKLKRITSSFHRRMQFSRGFICQNGSDLFHTIKTTGYFISESNIEKGDEIICPSHQGTDLHLINTIKMTEYWDTQSKCSQN